MHCVQCTDVLCMYPISFTMEAAFPNALEGIVQHVILTPEDLKHERQPKQTDKVGTSFYALYIKQVGSGCKKNTP